MPLNAPRIRKTLIYSNAGGGQSEIGRDGSETRMSKVRITNETRNQNDEGERRLFRHSSFGFDSLFWFRHSDLPPPPGPRIRPTAFGTTVRTLAEVIAALSALASRRESSACSLPSRPLDIDHRQRARQKGDHRHGGIEKDHSVRASLARRDRECYARHAPICRVVKSLARLTREGRRPDGHIVPRGPRLPRPAKGCEFEPRFRGPRNQHGDEHHR